ncbi:trifunctional serine/threonine-protein kinase/ATP-binding protein/sensor histidine kinase [Egbenema bharatensis]|uniref:trifunctional serine/threonine-protein kinase/ATP-binding protein/sensor histidine kinase n=1 Tax=Egbenema bharatensis TaxID=3463334 RepID=UPI003A85D4EC
MTSLANAASQVFTFSDYTIVEQLYLGSRTIVYRAVQTSTQQSVVIKVLRREYPSFSELVQFCNQYTIAKNLPIPGIIQPLHLEPLGKGYALVMEDWGGVALGQYIQHHPLGLSEMIAIAIQLADILHDLGQHRVVHKDIKPANILIHPETKQVKLIDFSIASLLPKETQEIQNPNVLEGTLAYLSPEQTGRMNRGIDYRSDFYSLGVTLFELATGQLPFHSSEPMELLHCHLAKQPPSICDVNPNLPLMLGEIIRKLMAKNAEDRYQSAIGLKHDLMQCQKNLHGPVWFELGQHDVSDRFLIPEKLYGREQEVTTLLYSFGRVANGAAELMLVAGFSGIGKTAVVNEVHKPIVRWNGYFIKGKYDQFNRNVPFSAVVQALRDLMEQLLSESDVQLEQWKHRILSVVGENGQVLTEVIPELEQIIGSQPPAPDLSGSAAQSRFNRLFQKFIAVFATPEHPLVMFLDDLQWADAASLNLMQVLMTEKASGYLMLIGAYRDNEVSPTHPLMLTLEDIQKTNARINTLTLAPLNQSDVNQLIADAFSCTPDLAWPFTELVYQKTAGNPFFITQFLKALYEDGLITFDGEIGFWQCDLATVRSLALTDDVVEFMSLQLQKLPSATQSILKLAACVGNQFDLATLAIVSEQPELETALSLWKALQEGFIIPTNEVYKFYQNSSIFSHQSTTRITDSQITNFQINNSQITDRSKELIVNYKFLHDRVQQAAYSLIPDSQKKAVHLKVGQLLLSSTSSETLEARIFDIVHQLYQGNEIIAQQSNRDEVAHLYLTAGKKAKASTAYKAAVDYFTAGIDLLTEQNWSTHYQLTFDLYREGAECAYLIGHLKQAETWFDLALSHAQDAFEQADIYAIQMYLKMTQGEDIQASFEDGLKGLSMLGMPLPRLLEEQKAEIQIQLEQLQTKLATICPSDVFNLPEMSDQKQKLCMSLLADLWAAAYMGGDATLSYLSLLLMLNTSLTYGNTEASGFAYCLYGMNLANQGDYATAYEFGTLALKLDRHFNSTKFIYKTNNIFAHTINPYNQHLKTNLAVSRQAFQASQAGGDVVFGVWAVSFLIWAMILKGDCLPDIYAETEKYLGYVQQVNDVNMLYAFTLQRQFLLNLQNTFQNTDLLHSHHSDYSDEQPPYIQVWRQKQNFEHGINWYCFLKLQLSYLYGRYSDAVAAAKEAEATLPCNAGFFPIILYHFYYPLSLAALYPDATTVQQREYWEILQHHQQIFKNLSDFCPENFLHKYLLLSAEMAALSGHALEAVNLYDRAIAAAKANEYLQEEALANELAATFFLRWDKPLIAQEYMLKAYYGYARWGAKTKVADLEACYSQLLAPILRQERPPLSVSETVFASGTIASTGTSSSGISDAIDLVTVLKTSQAISSEIELEKLLSSLLSIIIENVGADKCVLMLLRGERLLIKGLVTLGTQPIVLQSLPVEESQDVPLKIIHKVMHQQHSVVLIDAMADPTLVADPYIVHQQPKSLLCSPILHQGKLKGIVYLENNLATGAFTADRVELLNLLCAQAAISLENARLYERSQQYAQQLERSLNELGHTESRLRASQQRLQLMVQQTPLAVIEWDINQQITSWNPAAERIFGYTQEEALGRPIHFLVPEKLQPQIARISADLLLQQGGHFSINENITKDGRLIVCAWYNSPLVNEDGELVGVASLTDDITDQKMAELKLQQQAEELAAALQNLRQTQLQMVQNEKMAMLGNLVAGIAHEINNPIGFLNGSVNNAKDYVQDLFGHLALYQEHHPQAATPVLDHAAAIDLEFLREDLPKVLDSMKGATDRIKSISNSLRTFSRADTEYKVRADIHEGIDSTILILKYRLKANEFRPAIEVQKAYSNLPMVDCFPGQLNQVFMNILANAIDVFDEAAQQSSFNDLKAKPQRITIQTQLAAQNTVEIRIRDNGTGMSSEVLSRIFDHLFTTKGVGKGTGLGLAIARQIIVEKHGGCIEVQSEVGQGTEFCISLPMSVHP